MSSTNPLVSFIIPTHNRKDALTQALTSIEDQTYDRKEIVVVSDSDDGTRKLFTDGGRFDKPGIQFHSMDERAGITRSLNQGIALATGSIIITLDDDALFRDPSATDNIVGLFQSDPELGLLAFRTENLHSGEEEFPGQKTNSPGLVDTVPFVKPIVDLPTGEDVEGPIETTYFAGCGYAVRADVYEDIDPHPPTFFYGSYEEDLAFRVLDTTYTIKYQPSVTVYHKRSPEGTIPDTDRLRMNYTNRIGVAIRHLPWRYVLLTIVLWGGSTLYRTNVRTVLTALVETFKQRNEFLAARDVLEPDTISYIKEKNGRLY